jgi:circadian clock protein KaiC
MLGGAGCYRGSSVLVSGTAGTGKSSIAAHFAEAACRRGERALYFAFEESPSQIMRNMRSIGIDLEPWVQKDMLRFQATRPSFTGLEMHLTMIHKAVNTFKPQVVIVDPLSSFIMGTNKTEVKSMLMRLVDFLKMSNITSMFTMLTSNIGHADAEEVAISSLIDTWMTLLDLEIGGERNRCMSVVKSRGMAHSNQIREFLLTDHGVELRDVYVGPEGVLTGSARQAQEARIQAQLTVKKQDVELRHIELEGKRKALEAQIVTMRAVFEAQEAEALRIIRQEQSLEMQLTKEREDMELSRKADTSAYTAVKKQKGGSK